MKDITVPQRDPTPYKACILRKTRLQVVEQRANRADVQNRQAVPSLRRHSGQNRQEARFSLAARRRRDKQGVLPLHQRWQRSVLQGTQATPAQAINQVMLQGGVKQFKGSHDAVTMPS